MRFNWTMLTVSLNVNLIAGYSLIDGSGIDSSIYFDTSFVSSFFGSISENYYWDKIMKNRFKKLGSKTKS